MREGVRERERARGLKMPHGWLLTWRSETRTQWPPEAGKGQEQILLRSFQAELGPRQHLAFRASDSRAGTAHLCCFQLRSWPFVAAATGTPHGRVGERDMVSPRQRPRLLKPLLPSSAFSRGHFRRSQSCGVGCRGVGCRLRANARNHRWVSELAR